MPRPSLVGLLAILSLSSACHRPPAGPVLEPLTQAYSTPNGLITAHYPAAFAASAPSTDRLQLNRTLPAEMSVSLTAFETPISTDVGEFSRVGLQGMINASHGYHELGRQPTVCNGSPGVELQATVQGDGGTTLYWKTCAFVRNGHGYIFFYMVPQSELATWAPLLQSTLDSTTFNR